MSSVIDKNVLNTLLETVGGDEEFLRELIETFFEDSPDQIQSMDDSLVNGDAEVFRRAAHSMKSNSASFGAMGLSELCKELEDIGKSGDLDSGAALLEQTKAAYQAAVSELSAHLE